MRKNIFFAFSLLLFLSTTISHSADNSIIAHQFSQVQEQVVATTLQDWSVSKKEVMREKNSKGKKKVLHRLGVLGQRCSGLWKT